MSGYRDDAGFTAWQTENGYTLPRPAIKVVSRSNRWRPTTLVIHVEILATPPAVRWLAFCCPFRGDEYAHFLLFLPSLCFRQPPLPKNPPNGTWRDSFGTTLEFSLCGEGTQLCATLLGSGRVAHGGQSSLCEQADHAGGPNSRQRMEGHRHVRRWQRTRSRLRVAGWWSCAKLSRSAACRTLLPHPDDGAIAHPDYLPKLPRPVGEVLMRSAI